MSECGNIFDSIKNSIFEKFDIFITAMKQRRDALITELEQHRVTYNSKHESRLRTLQELEEMRSQMTAMYVHQNRAALIQEAALKPINEEIKAIKVTLTDQDYKLEFQLDTNEINVLIQSLGKLVETEYMSLGKPPAVPPRTPNPSRSSSPTFPAIEKRKSAAIIESKDLNSKLKLASSRSYGRDERNSNIQEYEEIDFAFVIPRGISSPEICQKPNLPVRKSMYSNKQQPIYTTCERGEDYQNLQLPMGIAYRNRNIYIVDHGLHKILVVSENGEFVCEFGQNILERPVAITLCEEFCYISDEALNSIVKYRLRDYVIASSKRYRMGGNVGELSLPKGLDLDSKEFIYLADCGNNRVCMLDSSLLFVKVLFDGLLQSPQDVKVIEDNIYVLDRNPVSCLHSFTRAGNPIQSVISKGTTLPSFLCSDSCGQVIISDGVSIRVFSLDGNLVGAIGEQILGWDSGVSEPMGICVTRDSKVVCAYSRGDNALCFY